MRYALFIATILAAVAFADAHSQAVGNGDNRNLPYHVVIPDLGFEAGTGRAIAASAASDAAISGVEAQRPPVDPGRTLGLGLPDRQGAGAASVSLPLFGLDQPDGPYLYADQLMELYLLAAIAPALWDDLTAIAVCESGRADDDGRWYVRFGAIGDSGRSLGAWQTWRGWYAPAREEVERFQEPLTAVRVADYVRTVRGRYGGAGGWSCADKLGIP